MDQGEEAGSASLKEDRARLRPLEGAQGGRGHQLGLALGPGPAGLAHRVLGDGRAGAGRLASRSTAAARTSSSPITRTRSPSRRRPGGPSRGSGCTTGWSRRTRRRCRNRTGNIFQLSEALDRYGREAVVAYLISGHYRQPLAFGAEQMEQAVAQVERLRNFFREHPVGGESGEVPPEQQRGGSAETSPDSPPRGWSVPGGAGR